MEDTWEAFKPKKEELPRNPENGEIGWRSPSNIALVKYWGKKGLQLPANANMSFTLNDCCSTTRLVFERLPQPSREVDFTFLFEGQEVKSFREKTTKFFERILPYFPFLNQFKFEIHSSNSFPHSSGIASSASGMSALALCLTSLEKAHRTSWAEEEFRKKAAFAARLGSGSATRSVYGQLVSWGEHEAFEGSSNAYGTPYTEEVAEVFTTFQDVILLIDEGVKSVSSSQGHRLLEGHPFGTSRFSVAQQHMLELKALLKSGDLNQFGALVEREAFMLHALMMTGKPHYLLMKPNTLAVIEKVWEFRAESDAHLYFTLDAGANVHLLFPKEEKQKVMEFVDSSLVGFCTDKKYICDQVGQGPQLLTPEL